MSAAVIVSGVLEGLQLVTNLTQAAAQISAGIKTAQDTGQPFDLQAVLTEEAQAENQVLAAIAAAKAAGR